MERQRDKETRRRGLTYVESGWAEPSATRRPLSLSLSLLLSVSLSLLLAPQPTAFGQTRTATTAPASQPSVVDFQPGIHINWARRQVEVDATVILRQGAIELFACCPQIREHEAIVRIEGRPLHLYQALGLIGLTPGHPIRWHTETGEEQAATGDAVEILVRYTLVGKTRTEPIERWMKQVRFDRPTSRPGDHPPPARSDLDLLPWVFAGSFPIEEAAIAADAEGTVIAVVDFGSALIALPESHSDSNAELWLEPATDRIPPMETRCTLVFRAGPLRLTLDASGRIHHQGQALSLTATAKAVRAFREGAPDRRIRIAIDPHCPRDREVTLLRLLGSLNVPEDAIIIVRPPAGQALEHDPKALDAWLLGHSPSARSLSLTKRPRPEAPGQLARDLRDRSLALGARTRGVTDRAAQLIADVRQLAAPPSANGSEPVPHEP